MEILTTEINGILLIKPDVFGDDRGYFLESYREEKYKEFGITDQFVQDNISKSVKGTVRGLHYQIGSKAQGKLCQVLSGEVMDVAVDIRFGSPTFGKHYETILSDNNHFQLWIPAGFAHGFSVLSEKAIFMYKCTEVYSKEDERSILYSDENLNINWRVKNPLVSEKDKTAKPFKDIEKDFVYNQ